MKKKKYFITGATGTFGKNFVKKIIKKTSTEKIVIFSRDELKQYDLKNDLKKYMNKLRFLIGDVRNQNRIEEAIADCDIVIHAAALKQVETCEINPSETIDTNINGSSNVVKASLAKNVKKCVLISTDKAVNPINLYGSSKLSAEKIFLAANNIVGRKQTKFSVIRYGNVSLSRGSVINLYKDLIKNKSKYLPVTSPKMTRFCISINEAIDFVYKCINRMNGDEIFVPKLKAYRILDIVKAFKMKPKIIGIRKGEKINEILISEEEMLSTKEYEHHFVLNNPKKNKTIKYKKGYLSNLEGNFMTLNEIKSIINKK